MSTTQAPPEKLLPIRQAVRLPWLPHGRRAGRPIHVSALHRMIFSGKLKAAKVGRTWAVTESDLRRAFEEAGAEAVRPAQKRPIVARPRHTAGEVAQLRRLGLA